MSSTQYRRPVSMIQRRKMKDDVDGMSYCYFLGNFHDWSSDGSHFSWRFRGSSTAATAAHHTAEELGDTSLTNWPQTSDSFLLHHPVRIRGWP